MPKIVLKNDVASPPFSALATTIFTKSDGVWVVNEDGTVYGPLGVGIGGPAGGSLIGSYPNPGIANNAVGVNQIANGAVTGIKIAGGTITLVNIGSSLIDPIPSLPGLRTLGTGAQQATAGNDPRLTNARAPTGPAGGDLLGSTYPNPVLSKLQGFPLNIIAPAVSDVLTWDGAQWVATPGSGGVPGGDLSGTIPAAVVIGIQNNPVSAAAPAPGDGLVWNGIAWAPTPVAGGSNNLVTSLPGAWLHGGLAVLDAVVSTGVADTIALANRAGIATAMPFVGLISAILGGTATVAYYGEYPWGALGGAALTPGAIYYLGAVAGTITAVIPVGVSGTVSLRIGYAKSTTILVLTPGDPIVL